MTARTTKCDRCKATAATLRQVRRENKQLKAKLQALEHELALAQLAERAATAKSQGLQKLAYQQGRNDTETLADASAVDWLRG